MMTRARGALAGPILMLGLAACEPMQDADGSGRPDAVSVPEAVSSIAAQFQDLSTARVRPGDGCYWYTHRGPVETTELPLRTDAGNPICTRPAG